MSDGFTIPIGVTVVGSKNVKQLAKDVRALGGEYEELKKDMDGVFNGGPAQVYTGVVKGLTKAQQNQLAVTARGITFENERAVSFKKAIDPMDQMIKRIDRETKAANKAATAINAQVKATARLNAVNNAHQARTFNAAVTGNAAHQIRTGQTTMGQINVANNAHANRMAFAGGTVAANQAARAAQQANALANRQANLVQQQGANALAQQNRHNNQMQMAQRRHQLAMQRIQSYNSGGGAGGGVGLAQGVMTGGIMKVIAYDALRRTLTNMYQMVGAIGDRMAGWVIEAIKTNDEMRRAATVFTGLGLIGMNNKDGTMMSIEQAENSRDPGVRGKLAQSDAASLQMMNMLTSLSISTASDLNEVVSSARQLSTDMLNKAKKPDWMENQGAYQENIEALVGLAAAFKSQDPAGRKMGWHMVGIQELFSGSSGGKKDTGMQNIRSMMLREGVRIDAKSASAIAKAVNAGKLTDAKDMIVTILGKSGTSMTSLDNQMHRTLAPNVEGVNRGMGQMGVNFTNPITDDLIEFFIYMRTEMQIVLKNKAYMAKLSQAGKTFSAAMWPTFRLISDYFKVLTKDPDKVTTVLKRFSASISDGVAIITNVGAGFVNFMSGFLGIADGKRMDLSSIRRFSEQIKVFGTELGIKFRIIFGGIIKGMSPIIDNLVPGMIGLADTAITVGTALKNIDDALGIVRIFASLVKLAYGTFSAIGMTFRMMVAGILQAVKFGLDSLGIKNNIGAIAESDESLDQGWKNVEKHNMSAMLDIGNTLGLTNINYEDIENARARLKEKQIQQAIDDDGKGKAAGITDSHPSNTGAGAALEAFRKEKRANLRVQLNAAWDNQQTIEKAKVAAAAPTPGPRQINYNQVPAGYGRPVVMPTPAATPQPRQPISLTGAQDPALAAKAIAASNMAAVVRAANTSFVASIKSGAIAIKPIGTITSTTTNHVSVHIEHAGKDVGEQIKKTFPTKGQRGPFSGDTITDFQASRGGNP